MEITNRIIDTRLVPWRTLEWLQGELKEISRENFNKLKHSLMANNFIQPFNIWDDKGKLWCLDGHHRKRAMQELEAGGVVLPETLPANIIRCADLHEAKKLVLVYSSIYARATEETLYEYLQKNELDFDELKQQIDLPEINLPRFEEGWLRDQPTPVKLFSDEQIINQLVRDFPLPGNTGELAAGVITQSMAMHQVNRLASGIDDGYYISALFNPHRFSTPSKDKPSVFAGFTNNKFREVGAKFLVTQNDSVPHPKDIVKYSGVGWAAHQMSFEFKPSIARDICNRYCPPNGRVLDPCAGWGGRMIGFFTSHASEYVAYDPAGQTFHGLQMLRGFLQHSGQQKIIELHHQPFEEAVLHGTFDMAFTSPPYFDTEQYSDEASQSDKKFNTLETWCEHFLNPLVVNTMNALREGGVFILNIGAAKYDFAEPLNAICAEHGFEITPLFDFKVGHGGEGSIGMRTTTSTHSGQEPFFLIRHTGDTE